MEVGALASRPLVRGDRLRRTARQLDRRPGVVLAVAMLAVAIGLAFVEGVNPTAQTTVNGLTLGVVYALGAVGLTLVYGILKLVNFAHGDLLTLGAYAALVVNVTWGLPFWVAVAAAMAVTAAVGIASEAAMWRPMRARRAGMLQLLLMSIGLALVIRNLIRIFAGTEVRILDVDATDSVAILGVRVGEIELLAIGIGVVVMALVALMLRYARLGKQMRALSDDLDLAETAGIDTASVIRRTWLVAGALAGLAGVLLGAVSSIQPDLGFLVLLPIFAAVVLGGIGNAGGALVAGVVLGIATEWSTLLMPDRWKLVVGFVVLILVLLFRPRGIFGRAGSL